MKPRPDEACTRGDLEEPPAVGQRRTDPGVRPPGKARGQKRALRAEEIAIQPAIPIDEVVDSTGAGDAYTAAFLYGLTSDKSLAECARLGTWCATEVIQKLGARLEKDVLKNYSPARF